MSRPTADLSASYRITDQHAVEESDPRIDRIRHQFDVVAEGQTLAAADFAWDQATHVQYQRADPAQAIVVPASAPHQTALERLYLLAPYRSAQQPREAAVVLFDRDDEQVTDRYRMHFLDPGRRPLVGMRVDETQEQMEPFLHPEPDFAGQPHAMETYWQCVSRCLRDLYGQLPEALQFICSAGCGSCIFGTNPAGCGACAGCLGGYGELCFVFGCAG